MVDSLEGNDYSLCLCFGLKKNGVDISLVVPKKREIDFDLNFEVKKWAPTKKQGYSKIKKTYEYYKYLLLLLRYVRKANIDIVHFQFFRRERIESIYYLLLKFLKIKLVYTAHNVLPHEKIIVDYLLKYIVYKSSNLIVVHSEYVKNKLIKSFRIGKNKIKVIQHGNFDIYLPKKSISKSEARKILDLKK